jgi:hypothetical protein
MGCGQAKKCHTAEYGKALRAKSAVRIGELNNNTVWDNRITCNLCDDCIGKTARGIGNWIWWCVGISFLLIVSGFYIWSDYTLAGLGFLVVFLGWVLGAVGVTGGFLKLEAGKVSLFFAIFFAWTAIPSLILLIKLQKVKRACWVDKQMKDKANQIISGTEIKHEQLMAGIADKAADELTDEERKLLEEKHKNERRVEEEKEELHEQANKNRYRGAILGIVLTVFIAILGLSTYNSGGYMEWLGIELSLGGFWVLLGVFLVYDILAIVFARKKIKESENSRSGKDSGKASF